MYIYMHYIVDLQQDQLSTCLSMQYHLAEVDSSVMVANGSVADLLPGVTCLGVNIDQELTFADHIRRLTDCCFHSLEAATFHQTECL